MDDEIQLINDGDGIAVMGSSTAVDRFLGSVDLPSRDLEPHRLAPALRTGAVAAEAGSSLAAMSGRWIKLTEHSAKALKQGTAMKGSTEGLSRAILTENGGIKQILEFSTKHGDVLSNPAVLAGAAGIMAQLAMQQTMDEITSYLEAIDQKVEDVLRAQKDSVLADMIAVGFLVDEAMTIRDEVGSVSEVTWSKVQTTTFTIARTQAYALRQLDALAEKLEAETKVGDLARVSKDVVTSTQEWIAVLARCFQLRDAVAVLELDRVLGSAPDELDSHRRALRVARRERMDRISRCTGVLLTRIDNAAAFANGKVLLHPTTAPVVVASRNSVSTALVDFHGRLGIEHEQAVLDARQWGEAAKDIRVKALAKGTDGVEAAREGVDTARRFGRERLGQATSATSRLSSRVGEQARRLRERDDTQGPSD